MANTLFVALDGPMQSWGERGRWGVRDTALLPTKSGLIGLIACALGLADDEELRRLSSNLGMGVRCDAPGTPLTDFHTTITGVLSAAGPLKVNVSTHEPETVLSWRGYLCDAAFLAVLRGPAEVVMRCADALRAPHWPPYLGRKSCPPARPLYEGVGDYESLEDALGSWPRLRATSAPEKEGLLAQIPTRPGEGLRRPDELVALSRRAYRPRYVREILVFPPNRKELPCTYHACS